jgi:hypothetical protein
MKSAKGVSLALVRRLWEKYNDSVFQGQLSEPVFRITRARRYWAKFICLESSPNKCAIYVSGSMHRGAGSEQLSDSLIHEMIHQWQYENGFKFDDYEDLKNHDETFTQWLPIIEEKLGIKLQESWLDCEG